MNYAILNNRNFCLVHNESLFSLPRVQRVANAFAEEVVAEHGDEYREAGEGGEPPGDLDVVLAG